MTLFSNHAAEKKWQYPPTLLQRLQDDEPNSPFDRARPIDVGRMRSLIQQEIIDLINHTNIEERLNEHQHRLIMESVLNYGISALIGTQEHHQSWNIIEKTLRDTILRFEPRIIPETLLVRPLYDSERMMVNAVILFEISGLIYWQPNPVDLYISGKYDFELDKVDLKLL